MATISSKHDVRRQVADALSQNYWDNKIDALNLIDDLLGEWNLQIDPNYMLNLQGDEGSITVPIVVSKPGGIVCDCCNDKVGRVDNMVSYSWYRMGSGRWEITAYVS